MKPLANYIRPLLNTYAILFFSQNWVFGLLLLGVSFLNPIAGCCALGSAIFSLLMAAALGFEKITIKMGFYSFNNLLLGLAFGTFYHVNLQFFLWLIITSLITLVIAGILTERLGRVGLPILSLPFIITFWLVLLAANSIFNTGLVLQNSAILQEIYNGRNSIAGWQQYLCENLPWWLCLFCRSLSAVLFQSNVITGLVIAAGLLIHSRIAFSLAMMGFVAATGFNNLFHIYPDGISYYHLGANFMMAAIAIGSFFLIPSWRSYLSAVLCMPVMFILVNALSSLLSLHFLPVFSLPFCMVNLTFLCFSQMRKNARGLQLVTVQHYSPERNLYQFTNLDARLKDLKYINLNLPFMGEWTVSQGYNGTITHLGDWGQALDFVITDDESKTYKYPGTLPEHFYCYNKPVLACADGIVETVVNHVEDNLIGEINTIENWGNTVVIKYADGLYAKLSHLKKDTIRVSAGQQVKKGEMIGLCGNSGRSPEPHLHFQMQVTPYIGSKTISYPFAAYQVADEQITNLTSYTIPTEGQIVAPLTVNSTIKKAFDFQPGYVARLSAGNKTETVEAYKDQFNQHYLYSNEIGATAYYIISDTQFYFTSFYGDKCSLLYQFYLAAYRIIFTENMPAEDVFPIQACNNKAALLVQDFAAPFYQYIRIGYRSVAISTNSGVEINTAQLKQNKTVGMQSVIIIAGGKLQSFENKTDHLKISVEWLAGNI